MSEAMTTDLNEVLEAEDLVLPQGEDWNPVEKVILERRSVRKYKDKQVPENVVRRILEGGRYAPSAGNNQPWKFIVIRDRETIDEMERDCRRLCRLFMFFLDWRESPLGYWIPWIYSQVFIRLMRHELHPIPFGALSLIAEGKLALFHGAPTVIILLEDRRGVGKPQIDLGCCGQNMVLTAHSMGLGTCWVGIIKILTFLPKWKRRLGVKFPYKICEGIAVGYPEGHPDGMVPRETVETDWWENGEKRTVY
jgi:nitroreductase